MSDNPNTVANEERAGALAAAYQIGAFKAFMAALREVGCLHYDGGVPGWSKEQTVKLILTEKSAAAVADEPRRPFSLPGPMSEGELDARVLGHIRRHGGG